MATLAQNKTRSNNNNNQVNIADILFLTLHRWPWLILSVVVCVGLAFGYLLRIPSLYTRSAEVLIKSDASGKGSASDMSTLSDMGLVSVGNNIDDEINKLKSPDIMTSVVEHLNLDITYSTEVQFHNEILYGSTLPIKVSFPSMHENESANAEIEIASSGKAKLVSLSSGGTELSIPNNGNIVYGDTLTSSIGPIIVTKTPYFIKGRAYSINVTKSPRNGVVGSLLSELNVSVKNEKGSTIILTVVDQSTERAEDIINSVIEVYNENWMKTKNQISVSTSEFINERLGVIEKELGSVDQDISSFKSEHQMPDVNQVASMYMSESQQASSQLLDLENQLQMTRYVRSFIINNANRNQVLPVNSGIGSSGVESQIAEYNDIMIQRNQYVATSSESNPVVERLDSQLAGMRSAIIKSIDNQIVALTTTIKAIQGSKNHATAQIAANPSQAKYLLSVERQQKVKESLYLFLLQKREENELSQAFTAYNTEVITYPTGSNAPTSPNRQQILLCAFLIGLALPFAYTFIAESSNTKVRGRKDVKDLALPFLGEIPLYGNPKKARKGDAKERNIIVKAGKRDIINEAFRVLRTNLEFMNVATDGANVIAFTSFNPCSGKSFISTNLAYTIAIKNKRVLLIDCDMRHGSASSYIGSPERGLADYLNGMVSDVNQIIYEYDSASSLHILPIGSMPPNPTELLENGRLQELLDYLCGVYDYIIFDCPPIEVVADTQIIDKYVDRTVFVLRAGVLERSMLGELEKLYENKKFKNMAFLLNGSESSSSRYGYSHSYRYGYGYGYGYGYSYVSKDSKSSKN
jgi:capsular exopolysaccharide synthesis family protein